MTHRDPPPRGVATAEPGLEEHDTEGARRLLGALVARYAALRSYSDRGVVRVGLPGSAQPLELPFTTLYLAPDRFRFEFDSPHPHPPLRHLSTRYAVGSDGTRAWSQLVPPDGPAQLRTLRTLDLAIAGISGVSCGAAQTVAQMLLTSVHGLGLGALEAARVVGAVRSAGVACRRIAGVHPRGGPYEVDIAVPAMTLHRLAKRSANLPVEELRHAIELDGTIDPARFAAPA